MSNVIFLTPDEAKYFVSENRKRERSSSSEYGRKLDEIRDAKYDPKEGVKAFVLVCPNEIARQDVKARGWENQMRSNTKTAAKKRGMLVNIMRAPREHMPEGSQLGLIVVYVRNLTEAERGEQE